MPQGLIFKKIVKLFNTIFNSQQSCPEYFHFKCNTLKHLHEAVCIKQLGMGSYSIVKLYQCKECLENTVCNKCFVVKQLQTPIGYELEKVQKKIIKEYTIGSILHHPCIIETLDIDIEDNCIIFEYIPGVDFFKVIQKNKNLHSKFIPNYLNYFNQLLIAIEYLHAQHIAHLDIKLENILITNSMQDFKIKLIDFGEAQTSDSNTTLHTIRGTKNYISPEEYTLNYNPLKADIWALGIILYEIIHCCMPWENSNITCTRFYSHCVSMNSKLLLPNIFYPTKYTALDEVFKKVLDPNPNTRIDITEFKCLFNKILTF